MKVSDVSTANINQKFSEKKLVDKSKAKNKKYSLKGITIRMYTQLELMLNT